MDYSESYARTLIARVQWTWAKTYISIPHEYIVRGRCGLTDAEFAYLINAQREYGIPEQWHKYNFPYLYIDGYKYWTMGSPIDETTVINRQKVFSEFDSIDTVEEQQPDELYNQVSQLFHDTFPGRDVYEAGCGTGITFERFHLDPYRYRGVDPSKKAIEQFKATHPGLSRRLFVNSFEESVNYWKQGTAVVLATFGAASYFMQPYLKILAESGVDYFIMFYQEGYCPELFKGMHHFIYQNHFLLEQFPNAHFLLAGNYRIVSSRPFINTNRPKDAIPEAVLSEAFKHGVQADGITYLEETERGSLYIDRVSPVTDDGWPLPIGLPIYFYYKDGVVEVESLQ